MESNYYLYCVTPKNNRNNELKLIGHDGKEVFIISYRYLSAFVSKTNKSSYETNLDNLQLHEKVIEQIMNNNSVLPMRFSSICKTRDDVKLMLRKYYSQFRENIKKVDNKVEMGIKIFYKIENEDYEKISNISSGKDYMMKRFYMFEDWKNKIQPVLDKTRNIHNRLSTKSCDSRFTNPLKNNLIFNGAYLVSKDEVDKFSEIVSEIKNQYTEFKIIFSGPWSPYNFVFIKQAGDGDE